MPLWDEPRILPAVVSTTPLLEAAMTRLTGDTFAPAVEVAGNLDCAWDTPVVTVGAAAAVTTAVTVRSRSRRSTDASGSRSIWTSFLHLAGLRPGASISPRKDQEGDSGRKGRQSGHDPAAAFCPG